MTEHDDSLKQEREKLQDLEADIDEVRRTTPGIEMHREQHFIDPGAKDDIEDNTIVPPG